MTVNASSGGLLRVQRAFELLPAERTAARADANRGKVVDAAVQTCPIARLNIAKHVFKRNAMFAHVLPLLVNASGADELGLPRRLVAVHVRAVEIARSLLLLSAEMTRPTPASLHGAAAFEESERERRRRRLFEPGPRHLHHDTDINT